MAERSIELSHCLFQYASAHCQRCQQACPQKAINGREIDATLCDDCGLCTGVCPTGAVVAHVDYAAGLSQVTAMERQLLVCDAVRPSPFPCLGFLNRRLLWAQAQRGDVYVELSHCEACRPAVYNWLRQEIAAANAALAEPQGTASSVNDGSTATTPVAAGNLSAKPAGSGPDAGAAAAPTPRIHLVQLKGERQAAQPLLEKGVSRRGIFSALLHAARAKVEEVEQRNATALGLRFDSTEYILQTAGQREPAQIPHLFPGISVARRCNVCGLCASVCPENALQCSWGKKEVRFDPLACTGCGLCVQNCGSDALTLLEAFDGQTVFRPQEQSAAASPQVAATLPDTDATDMEEEE